MVEQILRGLTHKVHHLNVRIPVDSLAFCIGILDAKNTLNAKFNNRNQINSSDKSVVMS